ncbi:N/A [soil metagenome]
MRILAGLALLALACSSSTPVAPVATSDAGTDAAPIRTQACIDRDIRLQQALDGARKSPNAALAVEDAACGRSVFVSGDASSANVDSVWRIGSVTKTFVSAVILTLVRDGKVSLDDPLAKWVPNVTATDGVTVRMLMNHSSGIFNYTEVAAFFADRKRKWMPQEIVDLATANAPYFAPGKGWHYSNTNYVLLGMIAEKAGAAKISALVRARAIAPAKLTGIYFDGEETVDGTFAKGFASNGKTDVTFINDLSGPWSAGAMAAKPGDLAGWVRTLYGTETVLDAPRKALLTADPVAGGRYGLGVQLLDESVTLDHGPGVGHGGDIDGFHTLAFYFPKEDIAVVAIVNQDGVNPNDILAAGMTALTP